MFWRNKRVLVTGGTGFIGSHLVESLINNGSEVTVPSTRPSFHMMETSLRGATLLQADLMQQEAAIRCAKNQDIVIHLAANIGGVEFIMNHPASVFRQNTQMCMNVLEASRIVGVQKYLVVSTACVYPKDCQIPTSEEEGFVGSPDPAYAGHGWSKRMEEFLASAYCDEFGLDVAVARLYNVYGPRDHFQMSIAGVIPSLIEKVFTAIDAITVWGDGSCSRSFLYVKDCVRGLMDVCERSQPKEVFNLGTNEEITIANLAHLIVKHSSKKVRLVFDTSKPQGQPRRHCNTEKASRHIGFTAHYTLEHGLQETMRWWRETYL